MIFLPVQAILSQTQATATTFCLDRTACHVTCRLLGCGLTSHSTRLGQLKWQFQDQCSSARASSWQASASIKTRDSAYSRSRLRSDLQIGDRNWIGVIFIQTNIDLVDNVHFCCIFTTIEIVLISVHELYSFCPSDCLTDSDVVLPQYSEEDSFQLRVEAPERAGCWEHVGVRVTALNRHVEDVTAHITLAHSHDYKFVALKDFDITGVRLE